MAVKNKLEHFIFWRNVGRDAITEALTDGNGGTLDSIQAGEALPTRSDLQAICEALRLKPTDIWAEDELDLLGALKAGGGRQHGDQTEFRSWIEPEYKRRLEIAIKQLGFKSQAAWFRWASEMTIKQAAKRTARRGI